jgi:H+-transporting ATPase
MLQALSMLANDFVNMARAADRATPSPKPNVWSIRNMILAAIPLASLKLLFCVGVLAVGWYRLGFDTGQMETLTFIMFVFSAQAVLYVLRERGHMWKSRPAAIMLFFTLLDVIIISTFAVGGILMPAIPIKAVLTLLGATAVFALVMDQVKVLVPL